MKVYNSLVYDESFLWTAAVVMGINQALDEAEAVVGIILLASSFHVLGLGYIPHSVNEKTSAGLL